MNTKPNFNKMENQLLPAIIQDNKTGKVLMQGYMNEESYRMKQQRVFQVARIDRSH